MILKVVRPDTKLEILIDCDTMSHNVVNKTLVVSTNKNGKFLEEYHIDYDCKIFVMENGKTVDTIFFKAQKENEPLFSVKNTEGKEIFSVKN